MRVSECESVHACVYACLSVYVCLMDVGADVWICGFSLHIYGGMIIFIHV